MADLEIVVDPGSPTPSNKLGWQKLFDLFHAIFSKNHKKVAHHGIQPCIFVIFVTHMDDLGLYMA